MKCKIKSLLPVALLALGSALLPALPAGATHLSCSCNDHICTPPGLEKTLSNLHVDRLPGTLRGSAAGARATGARRRQREFERIRPTAAGKPSAWR